MASFAM
ncbi:hypothetical protein D018_3477A, partial [Vibrio parahaemolyticus VP2007-007]